MTFTDLDNQYVWLDLSARGSKADDSTGAGWAANRIALKCESIAINTSKQVISHALPGSGLIYGESKTAALDLGMTDKTVSLNGIITEQTIIKNWVHGNTTNDTSKFLTSFEVAQLIHSYVDSSFLQKNQNPNKLIILIPSRVADDWDYYTISDDGSATDITAATEMKDCPLIPFSFKTRDSDNQGTLDITGIGNFPSIVTGATDIVKYGLKGFVRNFSTTFTPGQPFIEFSMDFQIADVSF